ncbi:MAG: caspase family protein [Microscillaceae bacterium]|nr:caspase family protein [Microscillaceae bacterium]
MRKTFLRLAFLSHLLFWAATLPAQLLYEMTFEAHDISYKGFMVYFNEQEAYMRVGYTYEQDYNVVNVKYTTLTGVEEGYNYLVMVGQDPSFITDSPDYEYNPDHFIWVWNEDNGNELPYVTDDPEFNEDRLILCKSFREINPDELTESYLNQFFAKSEPDFSALMRLRTGAEQVETHTQPSLATNAKMHLVLLVNTEIPDIGQSCGADQRTVEVEFREIARAMDIPFEKYVVNGEKFTKANAENALRGLQVGNNDVVVFYYSGHGFRWSDQTDKFPQLDMRFSEYTPLSASTSLALSDVGRLLSSKGARLNLLLSDCCNSDIGRNQLTNTTFMTARSFQGAEIAKLKKLFINSKGTLLFAGSSPGEFAWCNLSGGFFTLSFIQALKEEIGYLRNENPSWEHIVQNTVRSTQYKVQNCNGCQPQKPTYSLNIANQ